MNRILNNGIMLAVGAAIGSAVTWVLVKNKYKKLAQEDIESVRQFYKEKYKTPKTEEVKEEETKELEVDEDEIDESGIPDEYFESYERTLKMLAYKQEEEEKKEMNHLEVLSPEEFEECDYHIISLNYYNDGILTNDRGRIISNVDEVVGRGSLDTFGQYEEDSVFVADHKLKVVYEILRDYSNFLEND